MVTAIGASGLIRPSDTLRSEAAKRSNAARAASGEASTPAPTSAVTQLVAAGAPIDVARVASLREAISAGTYTINARAIAERMIALDLPGEA